MATLKIEGVAPSLDGEYELDISKFNGHELRIIKDISGVRGNELRAAGEAGDYDLVIAFSLIALRRAGRVPGDQVKAIADLLLEADVGKITFDYSAQEVEEQRPPASSPTPSGNENSAVGDSTQGDPTRTSGSDSSSTGDQPPSRPSLTGLPGSAASADSDQETLAS